MTEPNNQITFDPATLHDAAAAITNGSEVTLNRRKITTREFMEKFPQGATIKMCDIFVGKKSNYPVFAFKEDDTVFYSGGKILTDMVNALLEKVGGSLDDLNAALPAAGICIKLSLKKTRDGNDLTDVTIL